LRGFRVCLSGFPHFTSAFLSVQTPREGNLPQMLRNLTQDLREELRGGEWP
jgi:hypothetical protein